VTSTTTRASPDLVVATGSRRIRRVHAHPDAIYPTQLQRSFAALKWIGTEGAANGLNAAKNRRRRQQRRRRPHRCAHPLRQGPPGSRRAGRDHAVAAAPCAGLERRHRVVPGKFAEGFLAKDFMKFGWDTYTPTDEARNDIYAAPLKASVERLKSLPATVILTAENDPLRDEDIAFGRNLGEAGVDVVTLEYIGLIHDWMLLNPLQSFPSVQASFRHAAAELKHHLS
jgi:hypothetical protein